MFRTSLQNALHHLSSDYLEVIWFDSMFLDKLWGKA